ncbi:unnamed protein product, partial [Vitis vinifera]|uniref:Uncharacterized protein n=1 Tax=Vitis vinifera TaxID=29760 RepID=D7SRN8_VITVI
MKNLTKKKLWCSYSKKACHTKEKCGKFHGKPQGLNRGDGNTLIQNLRETSKDLNPVRRLSAAHTATSSCSVQAIGLALGFNSLIKIH